MGPEKEFKKKQYEELVPINTHPPQGPVRVRTLRCGGKNTNWKCLTSELKDQQLIFLSHIEAPVSHYQWELRHLSGFCR